MAPKPPKKRFALIIVVLLSIALNIALGYWYGKNAIYLVGYQKGQLDCSNQVNAMIGQGKLSIAQPAAMPIELDQPTE